MKILSLDKNKILSNLKKTIDEFVKNHKEIKKIILFGSLSDETYSPYSDIDLIIIIEDYFKISPDVRKRIPDYFIENAPLPMDIFPFKESEINKKIAENNFFIINALENGKVLFQKN